MSAWLVSKTHIDALVTYCQEHRLADKTGDQLGLLLWYENRKSLRFRYDDADACWTDLKTLHTYVFEPAYVSYIEIVKAAHCYSYQACEHPTWKRSAAKRVADAIEAHALGKLGTTYDALTDHTAGGRETPHARAYSGAAWGLDEADVQRDRVAA